MRNDEVASRFATRRKCDAMPPKRLFAALECPPSIAATLVSLNPNLRGVRWLSPAQMHLTLGFFGNVSAGKEEKLRAHLQAIRWHAFFLPLVRLGTFPAKGRPRVLWIGVGTAHPHLFQLHKAVQDAALAVHVEPDLRPWHPHMTLARCGNVSAESLRPFLKSHADFETGLVHMETFSLLSSEIDSKGSIYTREITVRA